MVDTPLDRLLEIDRANMKQNQDEFKRVAHDLDPAKTTEQVLAELEADHPTPDHVMQAFRDTFDGLIAFIRQKHIITIPSDVRPIVEETPPFARAITTASMDTPGPYEKVAKEAYFNVTLPGPHDTPEEIEGRMQDFNVGTIISTAVHEAYPGHYIQFLWVPQAPTKIRKLLGASTDVEGWAHYCEQMMLDEGYGQPGTGAKDERESKLIRLGQLQDALLRNARFVVGIEMHRGNMTFDQAVAVLRKRRLSNASDRDDRDEAGHVRSHVSLLHAGEARDTQASRRHAEERGRGILAREVPRRFHAPGLPSDQDRAQSDARRRLAGALARRIEPRSDGLLGQPGR